MKKYTDINADAVDSWNKEGWEWGIPITHEQFCRAKEGEWKILLTPTKIMPRKWLPQALKGLKILGLASGGAQQIPVFAALGANCSVLDYSPSQIKSEIEVAARDGYEVEAIRGDMTEKLPFDDETFDIIVHPVSNCYIKEVEHVFNECYRVLKRGGILVCGLDNGVNYITDDEVTISNSLPFDPLENTEYMRKLERDNDGVQFSHTMEEQIGCQLKAGFRLTDIYEDTNGEGRLHELNIPTFIATRAIKE